MLEYQRRRATSKRPRSAVERYLIYVDAARKTGILLLSAVVVVAIAVNRNQLAPYVKYWLNDITHIKVFGFEIDRKKAESELDRLIKKYSSTNTKKNAFKIDAPAARDALARAFNSARAIVGARLLWVDSEPKNNEGEVGVLKAMGIEVFQVASTSEALKFIPVVRPDVIISNVRREEKESIKLEKCRAHYYELPQWSKDKNYSDLDRLNADLNAGRSPAKGFELPEAVAALPDGYNSLASRENPKIIFYTALNGGISSSQCGRVVTNRTDVLLNTVVSVLEESNWKKTENEPDGFHVEGLRVDDLRDEGVSVQGVRDDLRPASQ